MNFLQEHAGWLWAGGGLIGAGLIFWFGSKVFGWKIAGIAAAVFLGLGSLKAALSKAKATGAAENEARQRQQNLDLQQRIAEAREVERERQRDNPGVIDENDPHLRD